MSRMSPTREAEIDKYLDGGISGRIGLGWTVRAKGEPSRFLRVGWRWREMIAADPEWVWIPRDVANFDSTAEGAIVLYTVEAHAHTAATEVGGEVVHVWTTP